MHAIMHHKLYMEQSLINQLPKKIVWRWSGQWKSGNIIWRGDDFMCIPLILPYHGHLTAPRPALFWPIGYFDCSILTYIYISRRFYPKRLTLHSSYSYLLSLGIEPMILTFASAMLYQLSYRKTFKSTIGKAVLTKDLTSIPSQYWSTFHPSCDPCLYVYSEPVSNGLS